MPQISSPNAARILLASFVGTSIEFYDFYIYATAASLVFGGIFFPSTSSSVQQIASFATIAVAFVARPFGAAIFGHFGDRLGRKSTLVASLLTMGLSTTFIAFLPSFAQAGIWAPLALCVLRFGQGLGLGGEWGGAALLAVESAPPGWRARYGMFPQLGAPAGLLAANGTFLLLGGWLNHDAFLAWGWRIPFALSALLVILGLWVRLKLVETPAFTRSLKRNGRAGIPLAEVVSRHWRPLITGTLGTIGCFVLFYVATAFTLSYATKSLGYPMQRLLGVQLLAVPFLAAGIIVAAWLADRGLAERRMLAWGSGGVIVAGALMAPMMESGSLPLILAYLCLALFLMGMVYGPLSGWLPTLFPAFVRYTGVSLAFNIAGVLGGGLTPIVATALSTHGGLMLVGLYGSAAALLSLIALITARDQPLGDVPLSVG
ncbi:MHS family MFS transporter [Sphingobium sp. PNB]|uniref:MFS transporter n=1 Tax=Sphingobium sp. PNB TaxID=863934 RepID=UPI001CA45878|nr:MFS transporter [Sphingobium sp. PNB]MCB4858439.1 MHS family MFS transporter [Sphingobium sp. PNB]